MTLALVFLGGVIAGYLLDWSSERLFGRRMALHGSTRAPMATEPPTTAELHQPTWILPGPEVEDCGQKPPAQPDWWPCILRNGHEEPWHLTIWAWTWTAEDLNPREGFPPVDVLMPTRRPTATGWPA